MSTSATPSPRQRLVVIGGGISGLAAARAAVETFDEQLDGEPPEVLVLERGAEVGGKALTVRRDGYTVEGGPTGFLDNEPVLDRLVEAAGLEKLPANAAAARRFLVRGGRLREIQAHPLRFARSGILSPLGLLRLAREAFVPGQQGDGDESVWEFARRRLGPQAADRLIAPMVLGVFAGDAKQLSLPAAFPRMRELEYEHGSLLRAMKAVRAKARAAGRASGGPAGSAAPLTSFAGGLQTLPRALAERGGFAVRTGVTVESAAMRAGQWRLELAHGETLSADGLVIAAEPWAAAAIVRAAGESTPLHAAATELSAIDCPAVTVVALGYDDPGRVPRGFGALIPRGEGYRILGTLWDTHLFPGRSPEGTLLVRAMLGGAVDRAVGTMDPEELVAIARADLARLLGLKGTPTFQEVVPWPRAIPQYTLGHRERVARVESALEAWHASGGTPLGLAGNALEGVAFGKAAARGWRAGTEVATRLRRSAAGR